MSDQVAVMSQGRILQVGSPDEIYRRPKSLFVANFVGRSNAVHGVVEGGTIRHRDGHVFYAQVPPAISSGASAILIIRPEDTALGNMPGTDNCVAGVIERKRFTGGAHLYCIRVSPDLLMIAEDRRDAPMRVGECVQLSWSSDRSIVLSGNDEPPATEPGMTRLPPR
jgi:ABC-type Fe3+/spermidine/putrescine transport system ATPase subunit